MKIGFMINSIELLDNAKCLIHSSDDEFFVMAINEVYDSVRDKLPNVHKVEVKEYKTFPFYDKVCAAAKAEELGVDIWMDIDSIIFRNLRFADFLHVSPVDQKNIGCKELDTFWTILYDHYGIKPYKTIETIISKEQIIPYFNMGFVVNFKHFRQLKEDFEQVLKDNIFIGFFGDYKYKIFLHQALFSCLVEKYYDYILLNNNINHPMHLDDNIEDKITIRYDTYFNDHKNKLFPKYNLRINWIYE